MKRSPTRPPALIAALLAAGCIPLALGGEGDPCGEESPCRSNLACDEGVCRPYDPNRVNPSTEPVAMANMDQVCDSNYLPPYLLTGNEVLALTRPSYQTSLSTEPSVGLTLGVAYEGGPILCHPAQMAPPGSGMPDQAAFVTLQVRVDFVTDDGAFDEHFTTTLSGGYKNVNFVYATTPAELSGDFDPEMPEHNDVNVNIGGTFAGEDTWGAVRKGGQRPGMAPESLPVGDWDNREP